MALENNFANSLFAQANQANDKIQEDLEAEMEGEIVDAGAVTDGNNARSTMFSFISDGPTLYGADADLLAWDSDQKRFTPASAEAERVLERMGEQLNIFQAIPGSHLAQQLSWDNGSARTSSSNIAKLATSPSQVESIGNQRIDSVEKFIGTESKTQEKASGDPEVDLTAAETPEQTVKRLEEENQKLKSQAAGAPPQREDTALEKFVLGAAGLGFRVADQAIRTGGKLAKDGITTCGDLISKWKADRAALAGSIHDNAAEQVQQRKDSKPGMGLEDLKDKGEIESSVKGINPEDLQKNAETMREDTKQFKQEFDQQREQFKGSLNRNLETIFQAMGYGDPMKDKATSLADFEKDLKELPERKQDKVAAAIEAISRDGDSFRSYMTDKSGSPEAAKADIADQEDFAKSVSQIKDDPTKEADKKYRDMLDNMGIGGVSIKEGLGNIFKSLGEAIGRVVERVTMTKGNIGHAVDMNQGSSNQQGERLG